MGKEAERGARELINNKARAGKHDQITNHKFDIGAVIFNLSMF